MDENKPPASPPSDETVILSPQERARRVSAADDATVILSGPIGAAPSEMPIALPEGYRLHEYRIEAVLGQGGFGITYLATDVHLDAYVAIKEYLPSELAGRSHDSSVQPGPDHHAEYFALGLERFLLEARTLAGFRHPNIVRVARFFEANRTAYMVMDYERGTSLKDWWAAHPLSEKDLLARLHPLLDGLELVHRSGILHRDIKPDNIRVRDEGGDFVLLDFGAASAAAGSRRKAPIVVTPGFSPIEQYLDETPGPASDLYALGASLYWLVAGKPPRDARDRLATPRSDVTAAQLGAGRFSSAFLDAVDQALQLRAEDRPQTVDVFRRALFAAHAATLGLREALTAGSPRTTRTWKRLQALLPNAWPLAVKMGLAMLFATFIPMAISGYYNLQSGIELVSQAELRNLEHLADSTAGRVSQLIGDSRHLAAFLAGDQAIRAFLEQGGAADETTVRKRLEALAHANPNVELAIVMNRKGMALLASDADVEGRDFSFREYFRVAVVGYPYASSIVLGSVVQGEGIYLSHPVRATSGRVAGVVVVRLKAGAVTEILDEVRTEAHVPFLIDGDGVLIHHPDQALRFRSLTPLSPARLAAIVTDRRFRRDHIANLDMPQLAQAMVGTQREGNITYHSTISDREEVAGFAPVRGHDWVVGVTESRASFEQPLREIFSQALYRAALVGAICVVLALLFARSIVRPLQALTVAARALKRGDYDAAHVTVNSGDEIGRLGRTFNVMVEVLRQREREHARGRGMRNERD
ncbi:cache domain-containing protein [Niveibacterium sp. SC-1]|uniref:protein kinase domain-containing protein n=1 Tax=Niveibacterium sp. SC-1 TaxID=3135646 RepID=UPI00311EDF8C